MALRIDGLNLPELIDALEAVIRINSRAENNSKNPALKGIYKSISDKYQAAKHTITEIK